VDRRGAVCTQVDPEIFYPVSLDPISSGVLAARRVCTGCPVLAECRADVMAHEDPARRWGITAGLTPVERRTLFAASRDSSPRSGAVAA